MLDNSYLCISVQRVLVNECETLHILSVLQRQLSLTAAAVW